SDQSAIQEIESEYGVPVIAVVTLGSIVEYLQEKGGEYSTMAAKMEDYRVQYGAQY
ncbi:hypothetical protein IW143_001591, partial [Coemansia sp. RSA 520]